MFVQINCEKDFIKETVSGGREWLIADPPVRKVAWHLVEQEGMPQAIRFDVYGPDHGYLGVAFSDDQLMVR